eukprot:scaffold9325_cov97-Isochrysis_galbana.AAC.2
MACAPARKDSKLSQPIAMAMEVPMADQDEYRPPTQSQKPNMLAVSMPNWDTASPFVESAAKWRAIAAGSASLERSQSLAVPALVIVSWVVKVLDATRKSVVSASTSRSTSAMCVASTFDTKWTFRSRLQ